MRLVATCIRRGCRFSRAVWDFPLYGLRAREVAVRLEFVRLGVYSLLSFVFLEISPNLGYVYRGLKKTRASILQTKNVCMNSWACVLQRHGPRMYVAQISHADRVPLVLSSSAKSVLKSVVIIINVYNSILRVDLSNKPAKSIPRGI